MKKIFSVILAAMMLASAAVSVQANDLDLTSTASYATVAPIIDGEIDDIWAHTAKQELDVGLTADRGVTAAYTQILWNESGLYFLAVVEDPNLTENDAAARNSVDFWLSEKNTKATGYATDKGDWHFCKASDGTEAYYTGNKDVYTFAESAVSTNSKGYVIEFYSPYLSDIKPEIGTKIGYTISVNDDWDNDGVRDDYVYWSVTFDNDIYWENTLALPDVEFVAGPDASLFEVVEEAPVEETPAPAEDPAPVVVEEAPAEVAEPEPEVVAEPEPEIVEPEPSPAPVVETAPQTFDFGVIAAISAILSLAGFTFTKKK